MSKVKFGAKALDRIMPLLGVEAWWNQIEVERLSMYSTDACILGQLFSNNPFMTSGYNYAASYLSYNQRVRNGFTRDDGEWNVLHDAWVKEINARREVLVSS